ncbi:Disease resistance protein (CC-NBS-LRR class) family [Rhynchospora pubera]|uniref:Disease resistance protein (CC-NBS-LRR class) family n=1 Tax=Rhynchospora pubera TaxID=906938 RepID=A0AAV8FME6_9POAL|nr:Disease resistance protein (CC-NBS-LRR class) family [Rhynchospora pubera]
MGAVFIFSVVSTLSSLLSSLRISGSSTEDEERHGIQGDLGRLERILKRIQATLHDAGEREIRDASAKLWLKELQVVAYQADDILDEWRYELLCRQIEESEEATSSKPDDMTRNCLEGVISDEMVERIKIVVDRFEEISRDKEALFFSREVEEERWGCPWTALLPTSHMMVNESAVFGRDKDKEKILDFVLFDNREVTNCISFTVIVGMGGVGKTTLAQLVYNDPLIRSYFDISGWVYVSPQFDIIRVAKEVLETISERDYYGLTGLSAVQRAIVKEIKGKKLFLVLDDVWNDLPCKWEQFLVPFRAAESVRLLVTTRDKAVSQIVQATYTYDLKCLPLNQCNLLFEHYAFGGKIMDDSSRLRGISKQLVKKCAGLPLAIKCIGRALSCNMCEDSLRDVLESELWESDGKDEIFPALKVSYYSLPQELKPCLLFCSLFPKGYRFIKDEIIYMWIAHGYIQPRGSKSEEGIGDEFIHELDRRSFIMVYKQRWEETFTLHDLIHDLARFISSDQFCTNTEETLHDVISSEVHHMYTENCSMINGTSGFIRTLVNNAYCQKSDLDFNSHMNMARHYNLNLSTNKNLRVLKHEGGYARDLDCMANLKHLRYFELNHSKLERLPKSTTILFNLIALKLSFLEHLQELPSQIGKLVNLRFLSISTVGIRKLPESLGELSNLQMLALGKCPRMTNLPTCIGNLINLKQLHISNLRCTQLPESCCMLRNLQTLVLERCWKIKQLPDGIGNLIDLRSIYVLGGCFKKLPKSINQLYNLDVLELSTSGSLFGLLCELRDLLNRPSLNICIENRQEIDLDKYSTYALWSSGMLPSYYFAPVELHQNLDICNRYIKCKSFLESLQPLNHLTELKVNGYEGIGYPTWFSVNSRVAIFMQCYLNKGKFFEDFGELTSLKSLTLIGGTLGDDFFQTINIHDSKVIFPALEEIELTDMLEWNLPIGEQDVDIPVLHTLKINNCPNMSSVPNFNSVRRLEITKCSISRLELNKLHWPLLESLHIEECLQLTLLLGLQSLSSLQTLYVVRCPQLEEFAYPMVLNLPLSIEIVECPFLKSWCERQQLNYIENLSCKTLATSGIRNIMKQGDREFLLEHLQIENSIEQSLAFHKGLCNIVSLEIKRCWKLKTVKGLGKLEWLRRLVLWDCPSLKLEDADNVGGSYLPPFLMSLVVHRCQQMLSLDLLQLKHSPFFTELEITNCKQIMYIRGLENLIKLNTLAIIQCPRLHLELLSIVPDCVVISGCPRLKAWCRIHSIEPLD